MSITIKVNQNARGYYSIVKDNDTSGTHENYNIVYNGSCNLEYFKTHKEAFDKGEEEIEKYETDETLPIKTKEL